MGTASVASAMEDPFIPTKQRDATRAPGLFASARLDNS